MDLVRLSEKELKARAKSFYFSGKNTFEKIYGDEFGRFWVRPQDAIAINGANAKVFEFTKENTKDADEAPKIEPKQKKEKQ